MNAADNNYFTGSIPSVIGVLSGLFRLSLGKVKYLFGYLDFLRISFDANHHLRFLNLILNDCSFPSTINAADNNASNGSFPSEIGLLTGLFVLRLSKLKYLFDDLCDYI